MSGSKPQGAIRVVDAGPALHRVCPGCAARTVTAELACPACGTAYDRPRGWRSRGAALVAAGVLAGVATTIGAFWAGNEAAAPPGLAEQRTERSVAAVQQQRDADREQVRRREDVLDQIEASVAALAEQHVDDGLVDGPIRSATCAPAGGESLDDLTLQTMSLTCLAVTRVNPDGTRDGHAYHAEVNWPAWEWTYGFGDPPR